MARSFVDEGNKKLICRVMQKKQHMPMALWQEGTSHAMT
jgi:hypothetical protein